MSDQTLIAELKTLIAAYPEGSRLKKLLLQTVQRLEQLNSN